MIMSSLRRLAKDHASLRTSLPPNYLFPPSDDSDSLPDDLTQLSIYLTGSEGTPYSAGLWLLHLRIPHDYPKSPPKATFRTRIFHPNVEETTGAVCLETLKRDWDPKLTLKDILVTISCLLIQPNPDSALNEKAGVLVREDYDGFMRQAKLMTRIHAPIPATLKDAVDEARRRGEENDDSGDTSRKFSSSLTSVQRSQENKDKVSAVLITSADESSDSAKENKPANAYTKTNHNSSDARKPVLGKRPLSELIVTADCEDLISLQLSQSQPHLDNNERPRKSPKHTHLSQATGEEPIPDTNHNHVDYLATLKVRDEHASIELFATSAQPVLQKQLVPTKYRTHARIGIKRL